MYHEVELCKVKNNNTFDSIFISWDLNAKLESSLKVYS